jgi:hypothetical protein
MPRSGSAAAAAAAAAAPAGRSAGGSYVVVFRAHGDEEGAETRIPQPGDLPDTRTRADWRGWIVALLQAAGLRVTKHAGPDGQLYALVDASPSRLAAEAERTRLRVKTRRGGGGGGQEEAAAFSRAYPWAGQYEVFAVDQVRRCPNFYAMQHGHSESWPDETNERSTLACFDFRSKDRAQLILSIMETEHYMGGAGLDFDLFKYHGVVDQVFPLHGAGRHLLHTSWGNMRLACTVGRGARRGLARRTCCRGCGLAGWNQPLDDVRDYFGEKIAFCELCAHWSSPSPAVRNTAAMQAPRPFPPASALPTPNRLVRCTPLRDRCPLR